MFADLIAGTSVVVWPAAGLVIFFTFMLAVYFWAWSPRRRLHYEAMRHAPLDGGERARTVPQTTQAGGGEQ